MLEKHLRFLSVTCTAVVAVQIGWALPFMAGSRVAMAAMAAMALAAILSRVACGSAFFRDLDYSWRHAPGGRSSGTQGTPGQERRT